MAASYPIGPGQATQPAANLTMPLELLGETMRAALTALAGSMPAWLAEHSRPDWAERYGARVDSYRHPKSAAAREALAETIGVDGHELLAAVFAPTTPVWLRELPAVERLIPNRTESFL